MDDFFNNETDVCPIADELIDLIWDMKNATTGTSMSPLARVGVPSGIFIASLVALFAGRVVVRPLSAMAAFFVTAGFAYRTVRARDDVDTCAPGLLFSLGAGFVSALFSLWVLNWAMFAIGAAVGGGLVHTVFMALPQLHAGQAVLFAGKSTAYWGSLACAGAAGGVVVRYYSSLVLEVVSSALGAVGIALSSFALGTSFDPSLPRAPFAVLGIFAFGVGVWAQRRRRLQPTVAATSVGDGRRSGGTSAGV